MSAGSERSRKKPTRAEMLAQLNDAQRKTLDELQLMGWSLQFVRKPLFQDPVPVVMCENNDEIGMLDGDGRITVDPDANVRKVDAQPAPAEPATPAADWQEKRIGEPPVPPNLSKFLNKAQLRTLHQMEGFGWSLKFIRRPLFQESLAVIESSDGERVATLEPDGNMEIRNNIKMREEREDQPAGDSTQGSIG